MTVEQRNAAEQLAQLSLVSSVSAPTPGEVPSTGPETGSNHAICQTDMDDTLKLLLQGEDYLDPECDGAVDESSPPVSPSKYQIY